MSAEVKKQKQVVAECQKDMTGTNTYIYGLESDTQPHEGFYQATGGLMSATRNLRDLQTPCTIWSLHYQIVKDTFRVCTDSDIYFSI